MWTYVIVAVVFAIVILAMASGVMLGGRSIRGSCGGIAGDRDAQGNTACGLCRNPSPECSGKPDEEVAVGSNG